jgi:hypothetical protein
MPLLAHQRHRLQPAEDLFDPRADAPADRVARMARRPRVDGTAPLVSPSAASPTSTARPRRSTWAGKTGEPSTWDKMVEAAKPKAALKTGKKAAAKPDWQTGQAIKLAKNTKESVEVPGFVMGGLALHRELKDGALDPKGKWKVTHLATGLRRPDPRPRAA